jgi:uncharacterized lipoprotein YmbA
MRWMLLLAALVMTGCAGGAGERVWVKTGATQADFDQDMGQCTAQAWSVPNAGAVQLLVVQQSCMRGKGWQVRR